MKKLLLIPRAIIDILSIWKKQLPLKQKSSLTYTFSVLKVEKWIAKQDAVITFPLFEYKVNGCNSEWLQYLVKEIFIDRIYEVTGIAATQPIRIIDAGSNIGLSVLFFKSCFPNAEIEAYEPNNTSFQLLQQNVSENGLTNIKCVQAAISHNDEILYAEEGFSPCSLNQRFVSSANNKESVPVVRLVHLIQNQRADLVKLDMEGAEMEVLKDVIAHNFLTKASCWLVEFHHSPQEVNEIVNEFIQQGFEYRRKQDVYCFKQTQKA